METKQLSQTVPASLKLNQLIYTLEPLGAAVQKKDITYEDIYAIKQLAEQATISAEAILKEGGIEM